MFKFGKNKKTKSSSGDLSQETKTILSPEVEQTAIYTMPAEFLPQLKADKQSKGKGIILLLYGLIFVVLLGVGVAIWYFFFYQTPPQQTQTIDVNKTVQESPPLSEDTKKPQPPLIVKFTAKDLDGEEVGSVEVSFDSVDADIANALQVFSLLPEQATGRARQAIGAIYTFSLEGEQNKSFTKPAKFTFHYIEPDNLTAKQENSLRLAREVSANKWEYIEEAKLDIVANKLTIEWDKLPKEKITILSNLIEEEPEDKEKPPLTSPLNGSETEYSVTPLLSTLDSDADGLTDKEEELFTSDPKMPDTDKDGYPDGMEVLNFYSPVSTSTLLKDNLVSTYIDSDNRISFLYPTNWVVEVSAIDNTITIKTDEEDFIRITAQSNPSRLTVRQWYLSLVPNIPPGKLIEEQVGEYKGVKSVDNSTFYLAVDDKIYLFTYAAGLKNRVDYLTTWQMIYKSFKVIDNES